MNKPSIPKGTRDFGPAETARRNYIFDTIRSVFALYGFRQIETPAMENLATLTGKYGDEGDKLLYKILDSGDFTKDLLPGEISTATPAALAAKICGKGLRYDLTVPFARYVVQHRDELQMPFKRFQIQPVWRADRPQKGRYREFWQCDADVVGSPSLMNEAELLLMADEVYGKLGINVEIKLNNRKILYGIAEMAGATDKIVDITVAIDKLDKIGRENVIAELVDDGLTAQQIDRLEPLFTLAGDNGEILAETERLLASSPTGMTGIAEMRELLGLLSENPLANALQFDLTLARGLNYYTGAIFEVKALDVEIGSIGGGGRYDNLTGVFGLDGLSGVGISFGADRIYDVLERLNLFPDSASAATQLLFAPFGAAEARYCLPLARKARAAGIRTEIYPDAAKIKKQMSYANAAGIPFVAIVGESEMAAGKLMLKNMISGAQELVDCGGDWLARLTF
ncbi:MAG: histidine--tRNA ligase [Prevotella sp.]|nr:histidine--tRNA ligase [Prevotella sp.]